MITPLRGKLIGRILPREEKQGSLYVISRRKDIPDRIKIMDVGEPRKDKSGKVIKPYGHIGSICYIKKYSGNRFKINGEELIVVENADILGRY